MSFFKKAERKQAKLRLALCGVSGSGKTLSALILARGMGFTKIAVIDTERGSASLYSDKVEFDTCEMGPPFTPSRYVNMIQFAEKMGYEIIIIDSLSHAWSGSGGVLDMHANQTGSNSYTNWKNVTPEHNKLIDAIIQSSCHIICNMRSKPDTQLIENEKGKMAPVKIGLAPIQREGVDYEFTTVFDLEHKTCKFKTSKDRTGIFKDRSEVITDSHGAELMEWLNSGTPIKTIDELIEEFKNKIEECKTLDELKSIYVEAFNSSSNERFKEYIAEYKDKKKVKLINVEVKNDTLPI